MLPFDGYDLKERIFHGLILALPVLVDALYALPRLKSFCIFTATGVCGLVFFFQAEDGIRDGRVTGVQTSALPISALCKLPVVFLTSRAGDKHRAGALALGADAYLVKPYDDARLLDTLARVARPEIRHAPA